MGKKVLVAMSGGVDSSVTALLLKEQGYEVCGVTMKLFDNQRVGLEQESTCCSLEQTQDARLVCHELGFPHYVLNLCDAFHHGVIDRFVAGYTRGETPNPCIDCNRFVKFPLLLDRAELLDMDYVATGHYARVERDKASGRYLLKRGVNRDKDQSYVLYAMTQEQLARTLFPLGGLDKDHVRKLAAAGSLGVADKPDSQDICFVPGGDYAAFLTGAMGLVPKPGKMVDQTGAVLGEHDGVHRFTVGQRKGLPINTGRRAYVTGVNAQTATVTVGEEADLYCRELVADGVNWISVDQLKEPMEVSVQTRYHQREAPGTLYPQPEGRVKVRFREPQRAVTPGQAVVFYDGDTVVGGGTILAGE